MVPHFRSFVLVDPAGIRLGLLSTDACGVSVRSIRPSGVSEFAGQDYRGTDAGQESRRREGRCPVDGRRTTARAHESPAPGSWIRSGQDDVGLERSPVESPGASGLPARVPSGRKDTESNAHLTNLGSPYHRNLGSLYHFVRGLGLKCLHTRQLLWCTDQLCDSRAGD
jgi:hypothetical protein